MIGANQSFYAGYSLQRWYDIAYSQCMYAKGNYVPGMMAAARPPPPPPRSSGYRVRLTWVFGTHGINKLGAAKPAENAMSHNLCLATLAACALCAGSLHADDLSKASAAPGIAATSSAGSSAAQPQPAADLYMLCAFYPKQGSCERVYQQALNDNSISTEAVRAEYTGYVRYLNGSTSLTDADRQYLKDAGVLVPNDLNATNQIGLHNIINDPALGANARLAAVNNFLSRAVEAELYCGFNKCDESPPRTAATDVLVSSRQMRTRGTAQTANLSGG